MRAIPDGLATHLAGEATTLCTCWRLTRQDGVTLGFTDHDRDLAFDGTLFEAASGLSASEATAATDFAIGSLEVAGALASGRLSEEELAAGAFDHARVETFAVNWAAPDERLLLRTAHVGEVTREDGVFRAELRGPAAALDEPQGRLYRASCDADLGDARCGIDLSAPAFRGTAVVTAAIDARRFAVSGLDGFAAAWFERGRVAWTSGANAGRFATLRSDRIAGGIRTLELWTAMAGAVHIGDALTVTAGCDKAFATCREKFANTENFRGFPHMPGNDFALGYALSGGANDGSKIRK